MVSLIAWVPGWPELLVLAFIVLLLFGNRLPSVMRNMGRGMIEFKKGMQGIEDDSKEARGGSNGS